MCFSIELLVDSNFSRIIKNAIRWVDGSDLGFALHWLVVSYPHLVKTKAAQMIQAISKRPIPMKKAIWRLFLLFYSYVVILLSCTVKNGVLSS